MAKEYKKYLDIPEQYRWDLEDILQGKSLEDLEQTLFKLIKQQIETKDSKYHSQKDYLESLKLEDKITKLMFKIENYLSNKMSINVVDPEISQQIGKLGFKLDELQKELGSEIPRLFKNSKNVSKWIKEKAFEDYRKGIVFTLKQKKHVLPSAIENFLTKTARANIDAESTFSILTNSELDFGYALSSNAKKIKITNGNRSVLLKDKDPKVRETAYKGYASGFLRHKQSLSNLLFQHFKQITEMSKVRKYSSGLESLLVSDKVDLKLLNTIYESVIANKGLFKKFNAAHKKFYKITTGLTMKIWDTQLPLVNTKSQYNIPESQELVLEALAPMGKEYIAQVKHAFEKRWVDYYPIKNKRTGAYSIGGSYGLDKKYILMNHDGSLRAVETLAHEMGHSMHSYYSDKTQKLNASGYPIFLAEIASIFNELMLLDYLLEQKIDDVTKFDLVSRSIEGFAGTVMRQTEWSNYEYEMYNRIEKGDPVSSYEAISKIYYENSLKYKNTKPKYDSDKQIAAIFVPHFYAHFYVYKYAVGYIVANVFFQRYKSEGKNALENYINNFLKAGGHDWPIEILKKADIDLYDKKIYKEAFNSLQEKIDLYLELGNKIFKK